MICFLRKIRKIISSPFAFPLPSILQFDSYTSKYLIFYNTQNKNGNIGNFMQIYSAANGLRLVLNICAAVGNIALPKSSVAYTYLRSQEIYYQDLVIIFDIM